MNLTLIAAVSKNDVIGKDGKIPWYITEDLKRFKKITKGHPVIMGRNTFESIGKPLSERINIVVTKRDLNSEGIVVAHQIGEALSIAQRYDNEVYVIGGERIYREFLDLTNKIELTRVNRIVKGDAYFPKVDWVQWEETFKEEHEGYSFHTYGRK
jgi:dihydrofolate reductase